MSTQLLDDLGHWKCTIGRACVDFHSLRFGLFGSWRLWTDWMCCCCNFDCELKIFREEKGRKKCFRFWYERKRKLSFPFIEVSSKTCRNFLIIFPFQKVQGDFVPDHVGPPIACCCIKLVDVPEMEYYQINQQGEICVKGTCVFHG